MTTIVICLFFFFFLLLTGYRGICKIRVQVLIGFSYSSLKQPDFSVSTTVMPTYYVRQWQVGHLGHVLLFFFALPSQPPTRSMPSRYTDLDVRA